jgi:hypothetical protein
MPEFSLERNLLNDLITLESLMSEALLLNSSEDIKAKIREALYCLPILDNPNFDIYISLSYKD